MSENRAKTYDSPCTQSKNEKNINWLLHKNLVQKERLEMQSHGTHKEFKFLYL